jgi:hypothetical protein
MLIKWKDKYLVRSEYCGWRRGEQWPRDPTKRKRKNLHLRNIITFMHLYKE